MPIATPAQYAAMLDAAQQGGYAYPAMNVTSIVTINAALKAFADRKSDGIIQVSIGGGKFASGLNVGDSAYGAIVLAEAAHRLAEKYDVLIGLHTDHCQPEHVDSFLRPLIAETARRREAGLTNLFQSWRSRTKRSAVGKPGSQTCSSRTCWMLPACRWQRTWSCQLIC